MILVDTNYLIDFILPPIDAAAESRQAAAKSLISGIEQGIYEAFIPEVVLHECFNVLVNRLQSLDANTFVMLFDSILQYAGWRNSPDDISIYRRALEYVQAGPKLEFSDAVIAARAEALGAELATFDKRFAAAFDGPIWAKS